MRLLIAAAALVAAAGTAFAQAADMKNMPGMANAQGAAGAGMTMADGEGEVKAVNAKAGTVTIHHGPIAALGWPAMTMAFKADPPSILQGIKPGQKVSFKLMQMGGSNTVTAIQAE